MKITTKIFEDYHFEQEDMDLLKSLGTIMLPHKERLGDEFYQRLLENPKTARYFKGQKAIEERKRTMRNWYAELYSGNYQIGYLKSMEKIGHLHKKIDLDCHYVNAAMHFVRNFCIDIIRDAVEDREERRRKTIVMQKILDINLDILTLSYREEELEQVFVSRKVENFLVNFCERFSYGMNLMLVLGLVGLSVSVLYLFGHEVHHMITGHLPIEKGIIHSLGTLLMVWVMIELMSTEIEHLRGGHFSIKVFVEVGLVAFIRDSLVASLNHESPYTLLILAGVVLILGVVYWLISRADAIKGEINPVALKGIH